MRPEPPCRTVAQQPLIHQLSQQGRSRFPEEGKVLNRQRQFRRCCTEVRSQHIGVGGVEDRCLHTNVEHRFGMVHQIGVQRIVAGHEGGERVLT